MRPTAELSGPTSVGASFAPGYSHRHLVDLCRPAAFSPAGGDRVAGHSGGVVDAEFVHELLAMFFDGLGAEAEFAGDLFVGEAAATGCNTSASREVSRPGAVVIGGPPSRAVLPPPSGARKSTR